jgi:predicted DNA-binding transcriptional regulator YafY
LAYSLPNQGVKVLDFWSKSAMDGIIRIASSGSGFVHQVPLETPKGELDQTRLFSPLVQISAQVAACMGELRSAVDSRNKVAITYTRADGANSKRIIRPLGLFFWGTVWTLGAWCELRQAFRNFRLDRIETLQVCDERYPNEPGRTLEDMIAYEKKRMNDETL